MIDNRSILSPGTKIEDFIIEKCISKGGSGITYFSRKNNNIYIIKEVYPLRYSDGILFRNEDGFIECIGNTENKVIKEELTREFEREIKNNNIAVPPYVYGFNLTQININIPANSNVLGLYAEMPAEKGLTIKDYLRDSIDDITIEQSFKLIYSLLENILFSHRKQILHLDIKPSNCFILDDKEKTNIRLLDFGSSLSYNEKLSAVIPKSSYSKGFSAPELIDLYFAIESYNKSKMFPDKNTTEIYKSYIEMYYEQICEKTDYYSIGAVLYYILFRKKYDGNINLALTELELKCKDDVNETILEKMKNVFLGTLSYDISKRYDLTYEIEDNQFIKDMRDICDYYKKDKTTSDKIIKNTQNNRSIKTVIKKRIMVASALIIISFIVLAFILINKNKKTKLNPIPTVSNTQTDIKYTEKTDGWKLVYNSFESTTPLTSTEDRWYEFLYFDDYPEKGRIYYYRVYEKE